MSSNEVVMWEVRVGSQVLGEVFAGPSFDAALVREAMAVATACGITTSMFRRFGSVSDGMARRAVAPLLNA